MAEKKQIKLAYFPATANKNTVLSQNGRSLDSYCIKALTTEELASGNYLLDATFLVKDDINELLQEESILKVLVDYGEEIFRISKVTVGTRYIDIVARQITISDTLTMFLKDVRPTNLDGQSALSWILSSVEEKKEVVLKSDILPPNTAYYIDKNVYEALHDGDNSFVTRWKGEAQRRGYIESINARIGVNRGFVIREGKNLTGFECTSNLDQLVTRAKGKGFDGIEGDFIDSPIIDRYNAVYTKVLEYSNIKVKSDTNEDGFDTEKEAREELNRLIRNEFELNDIDKIKASYRINFVQLEKTEQYKHYVVAESLYIGDTVRVYIPRLEIDIEVRALTKKYNVLVQKTEEVTLSNYLEKQSITMKEIISKLDGLDEQNKSSLQEAKNYASSLIKSGLKNSYVIVRENEIIIGDTQDINTMINVWRWNNNGLAFSSTGYYGDFGTAITKDGAIVADFIKVGILNADLIKTGTLNADLIRAGAIKSVNDIVVFNLDAGFINFYHTDGTFTQASKNGLYRYRGTSGKGYHYLTYIAEHIYTFNATQAKNFSYHYTVPEDFQDKMFYASCSVAMISPAKYNSVSVVKNFSVWANRSSMTQYQVSGSIEGLALVKKGDDALWDNGEPSQIQVKVMVVLTA